MNVYLFYFIFIYYFHLYLFSQARAQVRPVDGFLHAIVQRREITQGCAFWGSEQIQDGGGRHL